ncbi:hypothetical protein N7490_007731 [Penicillium lividum]|nr:hypothetical protein N7490_007731 [Penicillium lividum]
MSATTEPPKRAQRKDMAEETQSLIPNIINTTKAHPRSILYNELLPRTHSDPNASKPKVTVCDQDSFTAAKEILERIPSARVGVLNMASEKDPGGGWLKGSLAQEEALCLRSTLITTLYKHYYPLSEFGAIWSPEVAVFRDEVNSWCRVYEDSKIFIVGVVSVAALRCPRLTEDKRYFAHPGDIRVVKDKMRQALRVLVKNDITHGVLGALGCGAFKNPTRETARIYKEVLNEPEWKGAFEELVFAVLDTDSNPRRGEGNHSIFKNVFSDA